MSTVNGDADVKGGAAESAHRVEAMKVVRRVMGAIAGIDAHDPNWFTTFEDLDPDICSYDELMWLIATAPTPEAQAFLVGKHSLRQSIAQISGRPFV